MLTKLIGGLKSLQVNKKNITVSACVLLIGCIAFVVPFIHSVTIRGFGAVAFAVVGFGVLVQLCVVGSLVVFYRSQTFLVNAKFGAVFVPLGVLFGCELAVLAVLMFVAMLSPTIFLLVGAVAMLAVCGLNIWVMCGLFAEKSISSVGLVKCVKVYNISIVTVLVCLWLLI